VDLGKKIELWEVDVSIWVAELKCLFQKGYFGVGKFMLPVLHPLGDVPVGVSHHASGFCLAELSIGTFVRKVVAKCKFKVAFSIHYCRTKILIGFAYDQSGVGTK